jgi:hypothetical protein
MKKFGIIVLLFAATLTHKMQAQVCDFDTVNNYTIDDLTGVLTNESRGIFEYDTEGVLLKRIGQSLESSGWENTSIEEYSYNALGKVTEILYGKWISGAWVYIDDIVYTYSASNKLTSVEAYSNNGVSWENDYRDTYTYTSFDSVQSYLKQNWDDATSAWVPYSAVSYTYNSGSLLTEYIESTYNTTTSTFDDNVKEAFTYFSGTSKVDVQVTSTWFGGVWELYSQRLYSYTASSQLESITLRIYNNVTASWVNLNVTYYDYNGDDFVLSERTYMWNASLSDYEEHDESAIVNVYNSFNEVAYFDVLYDWDPILGIYNTHVRYVSSCKNIASAIQDVFATYEISLYPNPVVNHFLNVSSKKAVNYRVLSVTGQVLFSGELQVGVNPISFPDLQAGVYLFEIANQTKKLVLR